MLRYGSTVNRHVGLTVLTALFQQKRSSLQTGFIQAGSELCLPHPCDGPLRHMRLLSLPFLVQCESELKAWPGHSHGEGGHL